MDPPAEASSFTYPPARSDNWSNWLSSKVSSCEAAFSTAFGASESPTPMRLAAKKAAQAKINQKKERVVEEEILSPLTRRPSGIDVAFQEAWGAMKRVAVAAMGSFDECEGRRKLELEGEGLLDEEALEENNEEVPAAAAAVTPATAVDDVEAVLSPCVRPALTELTTEQVASRDCAMEQKLQSKHHSCTMDSCWDLDAALSEVTLHSAVSECEKDGGFLAASSTASSTEWDRCSQNENREAARKVKKVVGAEESSSSEEHEVCDESRGNGSSDDDDAIPATSTITTTTTTVTTGRDASPPPSSAATTAASGLVSDAHLRTLCDRFELMFRQNGGAECVEKLQHAVTSGGKTHHNTSGLHVGVLQELNAANLLLTDCEYRVELAVNGAIVDECTDSANAAKAIIDETMGSAQVHMERALIEDFIKLLAVVASRECMNVMQCALMDEERAWRTRAGDLAECGVRGVGKLKTIAGKFAEVIAGARGVQEEMGLLQEVRMVKEVVKVCEVAVGFVKECVGCGVGVLRMQAAEAGMQLSTL